MPQPRHATQLLTIISLPPPPLIITIAFSDGRQPQMSIITIINIESVTSRMVHH